MENKTQLLQGRRTIVKSIAHNIAVQLEPKRQKTNTNINDILYLESYAYGTNSKQAAFKANNGHKIEAIKAR